MILGPNIRRIRLLQKLRMEDVALQCGIDQGNLSRIERGKQWVSEELLIKIANALGVTVSDLFAQDQNADEVGVARQLRAKLREAERAAYEWPFSISPDEFHSLNEALQQQADGFARPSRERGHGEATRSQITPSA